VGVRLGAFPLIQLPKKLKGLPSRRLAMSGLYTPISEGVNFCNDNLHISTPNYEKSSLETLTQKG
jgi:hypothetical protein